MGKCEVCFLSNDTRGAIVYDFYYKAICNQCYERLLSINTVSSGHADYERGRDAEEHERDILQPQGANGISKEFIEQYPETARKIFSSEEIHRAIRS